MRAALPPDPGGPDPPAAAAGLPGPARRAAFLAGYRHRWLEPPACPPCPDQSAAYHLLRLRAEALESEAAALEGLLAP